jgi:hypothetical protein
MKRPLQFDAEFDLSVLSEKQLAWLTERAQNHHFDTVLLDSIDNEGASLTICYDDGIDIHFFVEPGGHYEVEFTERRQ